MKDSVVAQMQADADEAAAQYMGLPRAGYDGLHWGHLILTSKMIWAIDSTLQGVKWPDHAEPERAKALRMLGETISVFQEFSSEFCPYGEDMRLEADEQERLEQAEEWSDKVFNSLPPLPSGE
ncbi:hypothetical protein [uncultured Ruegeria sp.]|uniref:hypothetical protein n=1 Tax=uncultured Ruegeria sp. TaxID=259304 RepID=UPI002615CDF4|nr:hypothetical protein [uncultured Ruegeria sp.]